MRIILMVGLGSFIGGISRYLLGTGIQTKMTGSFPFGTLTVNLLGCFLIGLIYSIAGRTSMSDEWRLFLTTGVLGGFTTFSAFSYESVNLFREGQIAQALIYVGLSIIIGLCATYVGILTGRHL